MSTADFNSEITDLVSFLFNRREATLNNWRIACENDPALTNTSMLSQKDFNNLIPAILDSLEQQLMGKKPDIDPAIAASSHGLHRWQHAHLLPDLLRELSCLSTTLFDELILYRQLYPQANPDVILQAQQQILRLMNEVVRGSVTKHDELQRLEAANRANSLQQAIQEMDELARQRGDLLRTSSHDLRSGMGLISGAAQLLTMENLSEEERREFLMMLNRNLTTLQSMLMGLMDLARLEAGQEPLQLEELDAAQLLTELVASAQPIAQSRHLILRAEGPAPLRVTTDRVKLYRIAQNLVLNALRYTPGTPERPGLVSVSWLAENEWRWGFSIQDSGPGLSTGLLSIFQQQLKPMVEASSVLSIHAAQPVAALPNSEHTVPSGPSLEEAATTTDGGEGIGLQIVKRLCELIGASIEVESIAGRGTVFRTRMLIHGKG